MAKLEAKPSFDEKKGKRHKIEYRDAKYYVSVFDTEVFLSSALEASDPKTAAGIEAIAVLITLSLEHGASKTEIAKALHKVSRVTTDMPGLLACILDRGEEDE